MEAFGQAKRDWLKWFLALPDGIPSHGTYCRVFARLDPVAFGECVAGRMGAACESTGLRHIAGDGKAVRVAPGTRSAGCLYVVSAWTAENRLILGQWRSPTGRTRTPPFRGCCECRT